MSTFEKYIVIALLLLPFTLLRFGFIGLGEIILVILFLNELRKPINSIGKHDFIFSKFWFIFILLNLLGFLYNILVLDQKTGTMEGMLFDISAYIMIFVACFTIENYRKRKSINYIKVFKAIFLSSGIVLVVLYFISLKVNSIFGFPLRYFNYFSPLSNNIHQTAMFIAPISFLGVFVLDNEKKRYLKFAYLFLIVMLVIMSLETGSFKARIGLILGSVILVIFRFIIPQNREIKIFLTIISTIIAFLFILFNYEFILITLMNIFQEEDIGDGRNQIYSKGLEIAMTSPLVGLGAGPHIYNHNLFHDSHQTFLTVLLQTGLLGLLFFFKLLTKIIKSIIKKPTLFAALIPILIYALGGDILRRLPIWILLVFFYYYTISVNIKNKTFS